MESTAQVASDPTVSRTIAAGCGRDRCVDGDQHRPRAGTQTGVAAGRRPCSRSRRRRGQPTDRGPGRHAGEVPLGQEARGPTFSSEPLV